MHVSIIQFHWRLAKTNYLSSCPEIHNRLGLVLTKQTEFIIKKIEGLEVLAFAKDFKSIHYIVHQ